MPRGTPLHALNGLAPAKRPAPKAAPCRAGFGPHCQVLRTPGAFFAVFRGRDAGRPFPTAEAARAWLAIADTVGPRFTP